MAWVIHNFEPVYVDDEYEADRENEYLAGLAIEEELRVGTDYLGCDCDFENGVVSVLTHDREWIEIPMSNFEHIIRRYWK